MSAITLARAYGEGAQPRERRDRYVEPPEAVEALCRVEKFDGPVWDPAAGTRSLASVLIRHGYDVLATDANDPGEARLDFLSLAAREHRGRFNIVSNPPYLTADRFALRALALAAGKVALFLRLQWLEGTGATAPSSSCTRRAGCGCSSTASAWIRAATASGTDPA